MWLFLHGYKKQQKKYTSAKTFQTKLPIEFNKFNLTSGRHRLWHINWEFGKCIIEGTQRFIRVNVFFFIFLQLFLACNVFRTQWSFSFSKRLFYSQIMFVSTSTYAVVFKLSLEIIANYTKKS